MVAIEESKGLEMLKIEELQSFLKAHEMRLFYRNPVKHDEQALKVQHFTSDEKKKFKKWKGKPGKGKWKKNNNNANEPNERSDSTENESKSEKSLKKKNKRNIECFNCHKSRHYSYECFSGKGKQKKY